jgi:hypothetical protein
MIITFGIYYDCVTEKEISWNLLTPDSGSAHTCLVAEREEELKMEKRWCETGCPSSNAKWYYHPEVDEVCLCPKHLKELKHELRDSKWKVERLLTALDG